eukprot:scaffold791_cov115-Cylindrotheca_fusiformis.AAC.6
MKGKNKKGKNKKGQKEKAKKYLRIESLGEPGRYLYTGKTEDANVPSEALTHLYVHFSVSEIRNGDFEGCDRLVQVQLPETLTRIGKAAFSKCTLLRFVELPEGLQEIAPWLFRTCMALETVKIPSSVIRIGNRAFCGCRRLSSFELPHGLPEIDVRTFESCVSIETLRIPPTVSSIGRFAFEDCCKLKHVKLPPTLERIECGAFKGCIRLENIEIPSTVSFIGERAFFACHGFSHIRIPPRVENIAVDAFLNCGKLISIEIPDRLSCDIDLSQSASLMNVAIPTNGSLSFGEDFFEKSTLGRVVDDEADLLLKLKHRFDNCPMNKLCYYQSYHSSEDVMQQLHSLMDNDPIAATAQVDEFGMTPLHILSFSHTPNVDMLVVVMKGGHSDHIIRGRDSLGSTPLDYLCLNLNPSSNDVIRRLMMTRFDQLLGPDSEVSLKAESMLQALDAALLDWSSRRKKIGKIYFELANYERQMKILSLVELCLWKLKIDEVSSKEQAIDRESCRINSGASCVLPHLLPFLDKDEMEDDIFYSL